MIKRKFSEQRQNAIKDYCRNRLEFAPNQQIDYEKLYIAVWASDKTMSYLEQQRLPVIALSDLIEHEIGPTIRQWKKKPPHKPQTRGKIITLPEGMWLLYLVDYLLG